MIQITWVMHCCRFTSLQLMLWLRRSS